MHVINIMNSFKCFTGNETEVPFPLASYIHPLYISNNLNVYLKTKIMVNHRHNAIMAHPVSCQPVVDLKQHKRSQNTFF